MKKTLELLRPGTYEDFDRCGLDMTPRMFETIVENFDTPVPVIEGGVQVPWSIPNVVGWIVALRVTDEVLVADVEFRRPVNAYPQPVIDLDVVDPETGKSVGAHLLAVNLGAAAFDHSRRWTFEVADDADVAHPPKEA